MKNIFYSDWVCFSICRTLPRYERLFSVLEPKAFFIRAERLRHHLIFYYAHTATFYINKLVVAGFLQPGDRLDPKLESVMSVGVDEMSWDDLLEVRKLYIFSFIISL